MCNFTQVLVNKRYEKDSTKVGKASFAFAWVLDETEEERNRYMHVTVQSLFTTGMLILSANVCVCAINNNVPSCDVDPI